MIFPISPAKRSLCSSERRTGKLIKKNPWRSSRMMYYCSIGAQFIFFYIWSSIIILTGIGCTVTAYLKVLKNARIHVSSGKLTGKYPQLEIEQNNLDLVSYEWDANGESTFVEENTMKWLQFLRNQTEILKKMTYFHLILFLDNFFRFTWISTQNCFRQINREFGLEFVR